MSNLPPPPVDATPARPGLTPTPTPATPPVPSPENQPGRLRRLWNALTASRQRVALELVGVLVVAAAVIGLTPLKYAVVGSVLKSTVAIQVADGGSGQVLPDAKVTLGGASATTDKTGLAHFSRVAPGPTTLSVTKAAYATGHTTFTLGFGDQGTMAVKLKATGVKVTFALSDYVTGLPVTSARVTVGRSDAVAGAAGQVLASLTSDLIGQSVAATVSADGYNDLQIPLNVAIGMPVVTGRLVPAGHVYYLSNASGNVDLYQANLDGSSPGVILAGTGREDASTGILPNVYDSSVLALVSSRAGRTVQGQLAEDLYLIHPADKELKLIDNDVSFSNFRAWLGKTLFYTKSTYNPTTGPRTTLNAYDPATAKRTTVVACTPDGACPQALYATDNYLLYSMSGAPTGASSNGLFVIKTGATTSKSIATLPASNALRQSHNSLLLSYYVYNQTYPGNVWQSLDLASTKLSPLATGPSTSDTRSFVDSPGDQWTVSVDTRNGAADLYLSGVDGSAERKLTTLGSVNQFVGWVGDHYIVFSSTKTGENALYVVGVAGGQAHKIVDFYTGNAKTYSGGYNPLY